RRTPLRCRRRIAIMSDRRRVDDLLTLRGLLQGRIYWRRRCNGSATPFIGPASHHGVSVVVIQETAHISHREVVVGVDLVCGASINYKGIFAKFGSPDFELGARWRPSKRRTDRLEGVVKFMLPGQSHLRLECAPPLTAQA